MTTKTKVKVAEKLPLNEILDGDCIDVMNSLPANSTVSKPMINSPALG